MQKKALLKHGMLFINLIMSAKQLNNYPSIFLKRSIIELVVKFLF